MTVCPGYIEANDLEAKKRGQLMLRPMNVEAMSYWGHELLRPWIIEASIFWGQTLRVISMINQIYKNFMRPINLRPMSLRPTTGRPARVRPLTGRPAKVRPLTGRPARVRPACKRPNVQEAQKWNEARCHHNQKIGQWLLFQKCEKSFNKGLKKSCSTYWKRHGMEPLLLRVWKFHDFSITQLLHEINFGDSKSAKSAILTNLEALNCDF